MIDRGLRKWQPFIMPEQRSMIKQMHTNDLKIDKPILDEHQLYEINDVLVQSVLDEKEIKLSLWFDGFIKEIEPVIIYKIDPYQRKLYVRYKEGQQVFLFDSLIGAKIV
jgi:YolD-like protein